VIWINPSNILKIIENSKFDDFEFSPNLYFDEAIQIKIPYNNKAFVNLKRQEGTCERNY